MKNTIPKKNPCVVFATQKNLGVFHRPQKIPFGQNVRPQKILRTPPSLKYGSGAPGGRTCTGNYPKGHFFWSSSPTTVTVTDRHTGHSVRTFILHTLRAETWPAYNWYQPSTTSSFGKSPRRMSFSSSLLVHFCVRKSETTGPRVLILILVFIFILFEKKETP